MIRLPAFRLELLALVLCVAGATSAQAATYTLFGASYKNWAGPALLKNMPGSGTVTGPASSQGEIVIPGGRFATVGTLFNFFPGNPFFAQQVATFTSSQTATHTLSAGGGPGNLEFCPPKGNPLNLACNRAAGLQGYLGFVGFVDYDTGASQFGGTFRIARKSQSTTSFRVATGPSQFAHQREIRGALPAQAGGPTTFKSPSFVPTTSALPSPAVVIANPRRADFDPGLPYLSQVFQASGGVVTISPVLAPGAGWIQTAGPPGTVTPMLPFPSSGTGFQFTTGVMAAAAISRQGLNQSFTLTGGNYRGPDGQGNIVLVAGAVVQTRSGASVPVYSEMRMGLVDTTLPEPGAALGVALGCATLLALSTWRRRR